MLGMSFVEISSNTFKYDPFGRRIEKVFTQNSSTTTTNYVYDGDDTIEEADQNGNLLAKYARTANIDEPLAESRSGTASFYEADGTCRVVVLPPPPGGLPRFIGSIERREKAQDVGSPLRPQSSGNPRSLPTRIYAPRLPRVSILMSRTALLKSE